MALAYQSQHSNPPIGGRKPDRCVHCKQRAPNGYYGLCAVCHYDRDIRAMYKPNTVFRRDGDRTATLDLISMDLPDPPSPTFTLPGSVERIAVMRLRAEAGCAVMHPNDLKLKTGLEGRDVANRNDEEEEEEEWASFQLKQWDLEEERRRFAGTPRGRLVVAVILRMEHSTQP